MKALEIENLTKRYGKTVAVDDISLSVEPGEFFGFLGPNGAGKTSTIHCITGIARFQEGTIRLFGTDVVREYRDARRRVGLAPQEFNVDLFAKTWQVLDFVGGYYGLPKKKRRDRLDELLDLLELEPHRDKQFRALSGGLKRRVTLARAMMHDPDILILDEPTAGVDVELRHDLWDHFRKMNDEGKTIILTSHYLEEVELLCGRVAIIANGRIVADKPKDEYLRDGHGLERHYLSITRGESW